MNSPTEEVQTVEQRLAELEHQFAALRATVLRLTPRKQNCRSTVGTLVDDPMSREADRLGAEYRAQQREP